VVVVVVVVGVLGLMMGLCYPHQNCFLKPQKQIGKLLQSNNVVSTQILKKQNECVWKGAVPCVNFGFHFSV
jgi:Tfp pilus assembly protein PilV